MGLGVSAALAGDPAPPAADARPLVRLIVRNDFRPEDTLFPQLVEGRLVSDLADMETFRTEAHDAANADYVLTCVIRNVSYDTSTIYKTSRDADAPSSPQPSDQVVLTMDLIFTLADRQGKIVHEGKLSADASREFEISSEHTSGLLKEEMIDRAAQRIERLIRKKLKKR